MTVKDNEEEVKEPSAGAQTPSAPPHCRTHPLVPAFSICLSENRFCQYALSFGHQYLCRHPDHDKFVEPPPPRK